MPFLPETQAIIGEVERLSGRPVHTEEDTEMKMLATLSPARGGMPAHFVRYQSDSRAANYLVAYQLGFLVRLFSCPPNRRFQVAATPSEHEAGRKRLGLEGFEPAFAQSLVGTIITQVRTIPVGMRVDQWIRKKYPGLADEQTRAAQQQLATNERALAPEIRSRFPKPLVDANTAMNAAFASFWADLSGDRRYQIPYTMIGSGPVATQLMNALTEIPDEPEQDSDLITRWAKLTGLDELFHFDLHPLD